MKNQRQKNDIEYEIASQIFIIEVCFDICKEIPTLPGRGSDFLPFYYNLNFSKGIISLYSLLLSNSSDELSIKNFLNQYEENYSKNKTTNFEKEIDSVRESFSKKFPISLRNKIFAHIDQQFKHTDFTNAYCAPDCVEKYAKITSQLKKEFFSLTNHAQDIYPHSKILDQSKAIINNIKKESQDGSKFYL